MSTEVPSTKPTQLVEHFFRHESAKLVAVLTRAFGFHRMDLVEDTIQEAMLTAVHAWRQRGVPSNPAGWIHRVARNRVLDALRREKVHQRAVSLAHHPEGMSESLVEHWLSDDQLSDSLLRMMFVCCHPALDRRSQIAMTLKTLCGFSVAEIARGLLTSTEASKKRIQRAKKTLAQLEIHIEVPPPDELHSRLAAVQEVLYVMFNEGYSTSGGIEPLRDDICEEAARLCHMLCEHETFSTASTRALLALMLFHGARLQARVDSEGAAILLADQDRTLWDHKLIRAGQKWLELSRTETPSRFHLEAAIALLHCLASSVAETDWHSIVRLYDRLLSISDSPLYVLNRAIARAETGDIKEALAELELIRHDPKMRSYSLLNCAVGRLHELSSNPVAAIAAYRSAHSQTATSHERALLEKKLARLSLDTAERPNQC